MTEVWSAAFLTTIGGTATASEARRLGFSPELAAYIRTELRGDASRVLAPRPRAGGRGLGTRLRYWLNSFRGYAVLDLREERA